MMGMYPGGPPPNNPFSNGSNVNGGRDSLLRCFRLLYSSENAMGLANMPTSNIDPAMLHSQLPRFPFDSTVPQPYTIQPTQQQPPISSHNNRAPESEVSDLMNHIAELAQTQLGSR